MSRFRRMLLMIQQAIRSCFAEGYWINEQPWTDDLPWKN